MNILNFDYGDAVDASTATTVTIITKFTVLLFVNMPRRQTLLSNFEAISRKTKMFTLERNY